jgi:hypothetical protein
MTNNSHDRTPIQIQDYIPTSASDLTKSPINVEKQKHQEDRERLLRLFIEYTRRTGEVNYSPLKKLLTTKQSSTPDSSNNSSSNILDENQPAIIALALALQENQENQPETSDNTKSLSNTELVDDVAENDTYYSEAFYESTPQQETENKEDRATPLNANWSNTPIFNNNQPVIINPASVLGENQENQPEIVARTPAFNDRQKTRIHPASVSGEKLENQQVIVDYTLVWEKTKQAIVNSTVAIKEIVKNIFSLEVEEKMTFATALKSEHLKLARYIDRLLDLAQKYQDRDSEASGRSVAKLVSDLTYFRLYIEQHAQITTIERGLNLANDPTIYLYRLNQYLDLLPETAIALINILQNAIASKGLKA